MSTYPLAIPGPNDEDVARVDRLAARVLAACDGATSVERMAADLEVSAEAVWSALDRLADLGLLESRASPPAGLPTLSRRAALGLARVAALGAGAASLALPAAAEESKKKTPAELTAREAQKKRAASDARAAEQRNKAPSHGPAGVGEASAEYVEGKAAKLNQGDSAKDHARKAQELRQKQAAEESHQKKAAEQAKK
jgi:hypothetical protein